MITRFKNLLPEGKDITTNSVTNALITDDLGSNLFLTKKANVKVAILDEGAGYLNGVGYFTFDKDELPKPCVKTEKIMFPNASTNPAVLSSGDTVDLGSFDANTAIGFTVAANGWSNGSVASNPSGGIFRSVMALNPEASPYNAHTVLLSSPEDKLLVLGLEDLNRTPGKGSDEDFNDVIMAIFVDPFDAVDTGKIADVDTGTVSAPSKPVGVSGRMNWREKVDAQQ